MDVSSRCLSFLRSLSRFESEIRFQLAAACALGLGLSAALPGTAGAVQLRESFEVFPGAVEIDAEFGDFDDLRINGDRISATGFLFRVRNTSYGDGAASAFATLPDEDFAEHGRLTPDAIDALSDAQPFGLYAFEVQLPAGSGRRVSAPAGFELHREYSGGGSGDGGDGRYAEPGASRSDSDRDRGHDPDDNEDRDGDRDEHGDDRDAEHGERHDDGDDEAWVEFSFRIDLARAAGLLFDDAAPTPGALFRTPRTGFLEFFVSTSRGEELDELLGGKHGAPALDVSTALAWIDGREIATRFDESCEEFDGEPLKPRGELVALLQPIPEPRTTAQIALGLLLLARLGRPRRVDAMR